jgi:hypothetical protein
MPLPRFTQEERDHALRALNSFAAERRWDAARAEATATYYDGLPEDATARERAISEQHGNVRACHEAYGLADFLTDGEPSIAATFLASKRALLLRRGGRAWLEEFAYSTVSAYVVRDAVPGSHLLLRDLLTDEDCEVYDRLGSEDCKPGTVIAARVMPRGDGKLGFHGDTLPLPGGPEELAAILHDWYGECGLPADATSFFAFGKTLAPFFFEYWFDGNFRDEQKMVPVHVNGELAEPGTALYEMPPGASVDLAFAGIEELELDGEQSWACRSMRDGKRVLMGRFVARGVWLRIESLGRTSMQRMRTIAQGAFRGALRHRSTRYEAPMYVPPGAKAEYGMDRVPVDMAAVGVPPEHPEFQERVRASHLALHYGTWAQHPLPALDGRTPAQAVKDSDGRARVSALIEEMERMEREGAVHRGAGAKAFDFDPLRRELGLGEREREE